MSVGKKWATWGIRAYTNRLTRQYLYMWVVEYRVSSYHAEAAFSQQVKRVFMHEGGVLDQ